MGVAEAERIERAAQHLRDDRPVLVLGGVQRSAEVPAGALEQQAATAS